MGSRLLRSTKQKTTAVGYSPLALYPPLRNGVWTSGMRHLLATDDQLHVSSFLGKFHENLHRWGDAVVMDNHAPPLSFHDDTITVIEKWPVLLRTVRSLIRAHLTPPLARGLDHFKYIKMNEY